MDKEAFPRTIVIVPGWGDTAESPWWHRVQHYLSDYDSNVAVETVDFSHEVESDLFEGDAVAVPLTAVGDIEDYAPRLREKVEGIDGDVDIIAHSFGGLIARFCLERLGCEGVENLVTLGTPHQGTYKAVIASFSEGGRQMVPGSRFLTELNAGELREDVSYTAVWSRDDDTILRPWRAKIPGPLVDAHPDAYNIAVDDLAHFDLLWSRDVMDVYVGRLLE